MAAGGGSGGLGIAGLGRGRGQLGRRGGPGQLAVLHHLVEGQAGAVALAQADPADARRQALEGDALAGHVEPAVQVRVVREQLLHLRVGLADVLRVARQRHPAERPLAAAEQRPDVGRHEAGEVEGVLHALVEGDLADVVAVVDGGYAHRVEVEHGLHVHRAALRRRGLQRRVLAWVRLRGAPAFHRPAGGQVAVDQVVRRGLVGDQIGLDAAGFGALDQFGQDLGRVAQQGNRNRLLPGGVFLDELQRVVDVAGLLVHIPCAQAEVDAALLALDVERAGAGQRGGQGLRAAHAAQAGREDPFARQIVVDNAAVRLRQRFRRCPARCPGCRCRSSCRRSSGRT